MGIARICDMDNDIGFAFWNTVRLLLKKRKWTIAELGRRSGVKQQALAKGLRLSTTPQLDTAVKIAHAFDTTIEFLISKGLDQYDDDSILKYAFEDIRKSRNASQIALCLPFLTLKQQQLLLSLLDNLGVKNDYDNL